MTISNNPKRSHPTDGLEQKKLFTPGPVMVPEKVKTVSALADIGHRRPQFESILVDVRKRLHRLYQTDPEEYAIAVVSGSGTASNEMVIGSFNEARFLLIRNGEFGNRLAQIMDHHGVVYDIVDFEWGESPNLGAVEEALTASEYDAVMMTYQETSTAMINPVSEVGALAHKHGSYFFADAISAVGGEDIHVPDEHIDAITGVANKAVSSITGCSFVCVRREMLDNLQSTRAATMYLDLAKHVQYADQRSQTPNTPAVTAIAGLDNALYVLQEIEGFEERLDRYRSCASILREGIEEIEGLSLLLAPEQMSNTLTSVVLPDGIDLARFIDELDGRGYVVYPGKGDLYDRGMFQVGNMGEIHSEDCHELLRILRSTLADVHEATLVE